MRVQSHAGADTCPYCSEMVEGTEDLAIEYLRLEHVLEHVVREALGLTLKDLSFVDIYSQCHVPDAKSWTSVPGLLKACLANGITDDLEVMYRVGGQLAKAGAIGPMPTQAWAAEFPWKQPGRRMAETLERISGQLV